MPSQTVTDVQLPSGPSVLDTPAEAMRVLVVGGDGLPASAVITSGGSPIKRAVIFAYQAGDTVIVPAVAGKCIAVMGYYYVCAGTVDVRFENGPGGHGFTGQTPFTANQGIVEHGGVHPLWIGLEGASLSMELSAAIAVNGGLTYMEVDP
jgi:hypothetical protein